MTELFTLFLPGIESLSADTLPRMPALERLLARGRARPLHDSPWAVLAELAGGDLERWPVGPVSALGELDSPSAGCLRVEPLGADTGRQGAFRLPAAQLELAQGEAEALAAAFHDTFGEDGLRLDIALPERWYLSWDEGCADARAWRGFAGPSRSPADGDRPAPAEPALLRLLSEVELLFHAHPVNAARRERGMPAIASLHVWGGGMLAPDTTPATGTPCGPEEPYLTGLRRLGVVAGMPIARATPGNLAGRTAWPLAVETLAVGQLAVIEQDWATPVLAMVRRGRLSGVRIVTGRAMHETRRTDTLRVWRRPRPLEELC